MSQSFSSFKAFYPYYLGEHQHPVCRRLHFVGTSLVLMIAVFAALRGEAVWLWLMPVAGYGLAWAGHFFFEHNRPATFKHPLYSLMGDFVMFKDMLLGKISF